MSRPRHKSGQLSTLHNSWSILDCSELRPYPVTRFVLPSSGGEMQRVNGYALYELGAALRPIEDFKGPIVWGDILLPVVIAQGQLRVFLSGSAIPIKVSLAAGQKLLNLLSDLLPEDFANFDAQRNIESWALSSISSAVKEFSVVLNAELPNIDTYLISQKGIYSTPDLIDRAENMFPDDIKASMPKIIILDISQAGRCLAFDLPTAAGFHIWRAVEGQLRTYYTFWTEQDAGRKA